MSRTYTRELREPRPGEIESFLARHGVAKLERQANGELRFAPCPVCRNQTRAGRVNMQTRTDVNPKTGLWRCFGCGAKGNWLTLTRAFGDELPRSDRYKDQRPEDLWALRPFFAQARRRLVSGGHHPALLDYCLSRGIQPETLDAFRVSSRGDKALRWPLFAWDKGRWVIANARLRQVIDRDKAEAPDLFERAGGPTGLLIGNHLVHARNGERVFVWEGQWDAMTAYQLGLLNSTSVPNGAESIHAGSLLRYIPDDWSVFLGMDMDEAGERAVEKWYAQVDPSRLFRIALPKRGEGGHGLSPAEPWKDLNEWFTHKPTLTAEDVLACAVGVGKAKAQPEGKRRRFKPLGEMLKQAEEKPKAQVVSTLPWPGMSELFGGGLFAGETTGWLAPSGVGKTTAVNQVAVHAVGSTGQPVGIIALEGSRAAVLAGLREAVHGWLSEGRDVAEANLWLSELEGSRVGWRDVVKEAEELAKAGARLIVVDNLDFCADRANMRAAAQGKTLALAALIEIAKAFDAHVIVVWQPGKVDRGTVVNSGNQKGYAQTFQDADNYVNQNRLLVGDDERVRLELEKVRRMGTSLSSQHIWLKYVAQKRCYLQVDGNVVSLPAPGGVDPF